MDHNSHDFGAKSNERDNHRSQRQKILDLLRPGEWVSCYVLAQCSLKYCSRISELRKRGHTIENRVERHGKQVRGYFRLVASPPIPKLVARPKPPKPTTQPAEPTLFDMTPPRHRDLG